MVAVVAVEPCSADGRNYFTLQQFKIKTPTHVRFAYERSPERVTRHAHLTPTLACHALYKTALLKSRLAQSCTSKILASKL